MGAPVFCFSSVLLPEKNGTIVQAPAPHPPHRFLCFLLPLGWLPAPAPALFPPWPSCLQGRKELGVEGFRERKEPGIAPLQALVPLFPSQSLGVGEGQARCPQPLSLASNLADPVLGPSCCLWDWGGGSPWAGVGGKSGRKQWHDFPGQWGPCEEAWPREKGEFSRPTSHRTDQPARPGPDLPQFAPKEYPPQVGPGLLERRSRDHERKAEEV